jgi:hypothetical protein
VRIVCEDGCSSNAKVYVDGVDLSCVMRAEITLKPGSLATAVLHVDDVAVDVVVDASQAELRPHRAS